VVTFLRWEQGSEEVAPSVFAKRLKRRRSEKKEPAGPEAPIPSPASLAADSRNNPGGSPFIQ